MLSFVFFSANTSICFTTCVISTLRNLQINKCKLSRILNINRNCNLIANHYMFMSKIFIFVAHAYQYIEVYFSQIYFLNRNLKWSNSVFNGNSCIFYHIFPLFKRQFENLFFNNFVI